VEPSAGRCVTNRSGLSVLECLIALVIVLGVSAVAVRLFVRARDVRESLRLRTKALAIAHAEIERLKTIPYSNLPPERHRISTPLHRGIDLAQSPVVPESVRAVRADGQPLNGGFTVGESGEHVTFSAMDIGTDVLIPYAYYARGSPGLLEAHGDESTSDRDDVVVLVAGSFAVHNMGGTVAEDTGRKLLTLTAKWLDRGDLKELSIVTLRIQG